MHVHQAKLVYFHQNKQSRKITDIAYNTRRTAPGADNIPYWVFKHCAVELACVIANVVNKTLSIGIPPSAWRHALVTPIGLPKVFSVKSFTDLLYHD